MIGWLCERRTPPTVGCRTRETERGEEDAARPRVGRIRSGEAAARGVPSYELATGRRGGKEDAARPRGIQRPCWGELRDVKRPACNAVADRRMLNLRPSCASYAAGMKSPSKRSTRLQQAGALRPKGPWPKHLTHLDHGVETEAQKALRPRCPAEEGLITPTARRVSSGRRAYHSNRQTGVQRKKGLSLQPPDGCPAEEGLITPTAGRVQREKGLSLQPTGRGRERRAYHSNRRTCPEGEGLITPTRWTRPRTKGLITPSIGPCCVRRA